MCVGVVCCADEVRKERDKETKHDTTIELAAILHEVSSGSSRAVYYTALLVAVLEATN